MRTDTERPSAFGQMSFVCCAAVVLVAPWCLAAWEMWWFWPFAVGLFLGLLFFGVRLLLAAQSGERVFTGDRLLALRGVYGFLPFLGYASIRLFQADVLMDAERSFLLFLTPLVLAVQIVFGFTRKQLLLLYLLLLADLLLLGGYGVINHRLTGSEHVLWRDAYESYAGRASGTYFCPDHFSGIMELGFCLALGIVLARNVKWPRKVMVFPLAAVALGGVYLSKSRGGGLTIGVIVAAALVWGFAQWPWRVQWALRIGVSAGLAVALGVLCVAGGSYIERFRNYPWKDIRKAGRFQYAASALRAWRSAPWYGIGPGMHQHLWPHFAASEDGDREAGKWPTFPNYHYHLYEVHNDWVQLLEEYGLIGVALFLGAALSVLSTLFTGYYREVRDRIKTDWRRRIRRPHYPMLLGAILACAAMAFHSLGDFNLQMPATVWLLAAIVAIPVAFIVREEPRGGTANGRE
ncbi:MAG: O-antigen ligase family protein [Kiritimatiellae bacterium]|nr:O-antigen ligase family protein [Kiritimatiellia bacterium]